MEKKLYPSDIYYAQGTSAQKIADFINSLMLWENDACQLVISPATANVSVATASAGAVVPVTLTLMSTEATANPIKFAEFVLGATIADTVADAETVPTIDDATPTLSSGEVVVNITLPEGTYLADETITLTIADYTAKDGRTVAGGTCVITIVA